MSRPGFVEGVLLAAALSMAGAVAAVTLPALLGPADGMRLLVAGLAAAYLGYLLHRSPERTGRVVTLCVWLAASAAGWVLLPFTAFVLLQAGLVWLVRALYFHTGALTALADLGLSAFAVAAAAWALGSGSWLLAVWSFFLVQALFPWVAHGAGRSTALTPDHGDSFEAALTAAEAALERLATGR